MEALLFWNNRSLLRSVSSGQHTEAVVQNELRLNLMLPVESDVTASTGFKSIKGPWGAAET